MDMNEIKKLKELEIRLKKWNSNKKVDFREFEKNLDVQDSIVHNMLIAIQSAIDLGNLLIEKKNLEIPSSYSDIFHILMKHDLIEKSLASQMEKLAKFRNVLVHLYWDVDLKIVYNVLKTKDIVLKEFLKVVKGLLKE